MTHINDKETKENIKTEPNFSKTMSTIDMTHFNDATMGPYIETEPSPTGSDVERNETMCRMAVSLCSDEQFNSHNEISIGNTTVTQVDQANQNDPGSTRILTDSRHESDSNNTNQEYNKTLKVIQTQKCNKILKEMVPHI